MVIAICFFCHGGKNGRLPYSCRCVWTVEAGGKDAPAVGRLSEPFSPSQSVV